MGYSIEDYADRWTSPIVPPNAFKKEEEIEAVNKIYFTVTGLHYHLGDEFLEIGNKINLVKEPENAFDHEAILVKLPGLGTIGHVANSVRTVLGESYSAGRLYDKIGDEAVGIVKYKLDRGIICELEVEAQQEDKA